MLHEEVKFQHLLLSMFCILTLPHARGGSLVIRKVVLYVREIIAVK